ncbi:MAG: TIGR00725 family protein [Deltaproteobacteria bacterium]|nr:TIGR00725 family protein [Deltaproteobacteria bacterium]
MRRAPQAVLIGDSQAPAATLRRAAAVGTLLARLGITLVTGGMGGVMEAASRAARRGGGLVVGIVPSADLAAANPWCSVVIPTGMGHARNALTAIAGDVVIAIGGGAGTLSEIALAWIHARPILVLGGAGGWGDAVARAGALDARRTSTITACADLAALERALRTLKLVPARRAQRR